MIESSFVASVNFTLYFPDRHTTKTDERARSGAVRCEAMVCIELGGTLPAPLLVLGLQKYYCTSKYVPAHDSGDFE